MLYILCSSFFPYGINKVFIFCFTQFLLCACLIRRDQLKMLPDRRKSPLSDSMNKKAASYEQYVRTISFHCFTLALIFRIILSAKPFWTSHVVQPVREALNVTPTSSTRASIHASRKRLLNSIITGHTLRSLGTSRNITTGRCLQVSPEKNACTGQTFAEISSKCSVSLVWFLHLDTGSQNMHQRVKKLN